MRDKPNMRVISAAIKVLISIVLVPLALVAGLVSTMFNVRAKLSASEVAAYLRNYIQGTGRESDWDHFTSVPIADQRLDEIGRKAAAVTAPDTKEAPTILRGVLVDAEQLAAQKT